ncbi:MAG: hypothetical protein VB125_02105 [Burkholderia sp.]
MYLAALKSVRAGLLSAVPKTADDYEALLPWKIGKPAKKPAT